MLSRSRPKAFTLLELIVVLVVLALLAALAIPTFRAVIERSRTSSALRAAESFGREVVSLGAFDGVLPVSEADVSAALPDAPGVTRVSGAALSPRGGDLTLSVLVGADATPVTLVFSGNSVTAELTGSGSGDGPGSGAPGAGENNASPWSGMGSVVTAGTGIVWKDGELAYVARSTHVFTAFKPVDGATGYNVYVVPEGTARGPEHRVEVGGEPYTLPDATWGNQFDADSTPDTIANGHYQGWYYANGIGAAYAAYTADANTRPEAITNTRWSFYLEPVMADGSIGEPFLLLAKKPTPPQPAVDFTTSLTIERTAENEQGMRWGLRFSDSVLSLQPDSYYYEVFAYTGSGVTREAAVSELQSTLEYARSEDAYGWPRVSLFPTSTPHLYNVPSSRGEWNCYAMGLELPTWEVVDISSNIVCAQD